MRVEIVLCFFLVLVYTQNPEPSPEPQPVPGVVPVPVPGVTPEPVPGVVPVPVPDWNPEPSPEPSPAPDPNQHIYDIVDLSLKVVLIAVGLFWVIAGLKYMKKKPYATLILAGFLIFYYVSYQLLYRFTVMPNYLQNWVVYVLSAVGGVIGASLFFLSKEFHVGRFFFSALSGVLLTTLLFTYTPLGTVDLAHQYQLIIIGGVGVILGFLSIIKPFRIIISIIVSSFNGAFIMCNAIDSLVKFSNVADLLRTIWQSSWDERFIVVPLNLDNWHIYVILGAIIIISIVGIIVQSRLTARTIIEDKRRKQEKKRVADLDPEKVPLMD